MTAKKYPVVEIFGPTLQGEGALAGHVTHFIRMGGCDYACAWCDSAPAVLPELVRKAAKLTTDDILADLGRLDGDPDWVTISGGNPVLHDLSDLVHRLRMADRPLKIAVETQGTIFKDWLLQVDLLTVSPKGPSSGNVTSYEVTKEFLRQAGIRPGTVLKVVVFDEDDYHYAKAVHINFPSIPFYLSVGTLMGGLHGDFLPPGTAGSIMAPQFQHELLIDDREAILNRYKNLAELTAADPAMGDVAVLPQLHALMWGHERGH